MSMPSITRPLSDLAQVVQGPPANRPDEAADPGILRVRHVAPHGMNDEPFLSAVDLRPRLDGVNRDGVVILEGGDVVTTTRGTVFGAAIVPDTLQGMELGAGLALVRLHPDAGAPLTPRLLRAFLLSVAWDQILTHERGPQGQLALRLKTLRGLAVPIPSTQLRDRLEDLMVATEDYRQAAHQAIALREQATVDAVRTWLGGGQ